MPPRSRQSGRSRRGSVLVAMLALVAILSAMLIAFLAEATERIKYSGLLDNRADLRSQTYSALEIALAVLSEVAEIDDGLRSPSQGWDKPLEYAKLEPFGEGYKVSYEFIDESSRLPLSTLGQDELMLLFDVMDLPRADAENLANALLDWMDADDNARLDSLDGDDYERKEPPYRSANAVPQSWDEFALIEGYKELFWDEKGRPTPLFAQFRDAVSLINTGKVNINSAPPLVVTVLARMGNVDEERVEDELAGFDRERGTGDDLIVSNSTDLPWLEQVPMASFKCELMRVRATVSYGEASFSVDALVRWKGASPSTSTQGGEAAIPDAWDLFPEKPASALGYPFELVQVTENRRK